jgi:hypothetical protein
MRQCMMTLMALAVFGAVVAAARAENQTPNPRTVSGPVKKRTVAQTAPSQAFRAATEYHAGSDPWGAHYKVRHRAPHARQVMQPVPTKRAVDPLYESCEYPWRHLELSCPLGR